ncbi:unconventional myosin-XVIIIa-like isoform X2 [Oratosquilla oratoria]
MFGFMKKDKDKEEKEKKKKDKKDRKDGKRSKERASLTLDELKRLDEARRSLIGKGRKKEKEKLPSGITADYMDQFRSGLDDRDGGFTTCASTFKELRDRYEAMASGTSLHSDSSGDRGSPGPNLPPRPPKRGILKAKGSCEYQGVQGNIDDESSLLQNTMQNELIMFENLMKEGVISPSQRLQYDLLQSPKKVSNGSAVLSPRSPSGHSLLRVPLLEEGTIIDSSSPLAPVLQSPTPPTSPTTPVPVGESLGQQCTKTFNADLRLPALVPARPPAPRTLSIVRTPAGDFGFSLRRAQVVERGADNSETKRTIVFAEPGALGRANVTGLLPGDRLLKVNGISVENKSRDEIIELIKASVESVTLMVSVIFSYVFKINTILIIGKK